MEKFAVDLEKVLDEFEFNEEREEQVPHTSVKAQSLSHIGICQVPLGCTPAASYRRPSFEPINLAEADFAASPPSTSLSNYNNELVNTHNFNKENLLILNNTLSNRSFINPSASKNLQSVNNFISIEEVTTEKDQESFQPDTNWSVNNGVNTSVVEEKPDLLDYNSVSPSSVSIQTNHIPTQLPDITTSVWTLPDVQNRSDAKGEHVTNAPLLDLINSSCGNLLHQISVQENVIESKTNLYRDTENLSEVQHSTHVQENVTDLLQRDSVKCNDDFCHSDYTEHNLKGSETEDNNISANTSVNSCMTITDVPSYHVHPTLIQNETNCKLDNSSEFIHADNNTHVTKTINVIESEVFSDTSHLYVDTRGQVNSYGNEYPDKNVSVAISSTEGPLETQNNVDELDKPLDRNYKKEYFEPIDINENLKEKRELEERKSSDHLVQTSAQIESEVAAVSNPKIDSDVTPVSFMCDNDISEGELEQFLQDLIEEENSKIVLDKELKNRTENELNKQGIDFNNVTETVLHNDALENKLPDKSTEYLISVETRSIESTNASININKTPVNFHLGSNSTYQEPAFQNTVGTLPTENYNKVINGAINTEKEAINTHKVLEGSLLIASKESSSFATSLPETNIISKTESNEDQIIQTIDRDKQTTFDTTDFPKYDTVSSQVTINTTGLSKYYVDRQATPDTTGLPKHDADGQNTTDTTDLRMHDVDRQTTSGACSLPNFDDVDSRTTPNTISLPKYDDISSRITTDLTGLPNYDDVESTTTYTTGLPKYDDVNSQIIPDTTGLPKYDDVVQESANRCITQVSNSETKVAIKGELHMKDKENACSRDTEMKNTFSETSGPSESNADSVTTPKIYSELEHSKVVHEDGKQLKTNVNKIHDTGTDGCHLQNEVNEHNSNVHMQCKEGLEDCVLSKIEQNTSEFSNDNLDKVENEDKSVSSSGVHPDNIEATDLEQVVNLENNENCSQNLNSKCSDESNLSFETHSSNPSEDNISVTDNKAVDTMDANAKMIPIKNGVEVVLQTTVDEAGIPAEEERPPRPSFLELANRITVNDEATNTTSPSTRAQDSHLQI